MDHEDQTLFYPTLPPEVKGHIYIHTYIHTFHNSNTMNMKVVMIYQNKYKKQTHR
jgi:hypothetical protein